MLFIAAEGALTRTSGWLHWGVCFAQLRKAEKLLCIWAFVWFSYLLNCICKQAADFAGGTSSSSSFHQTSDEEVRYTDIPLSSSAIISRCKASRKKSVPLRRRCSTFAKVRALSSLGRRAASGASGDEVHAVLHWSCSRFVTNFYRLPDCLLKDL